MLWSCERQERQAGTAGEPGLALAEPLRGRIAGKDDDVHADNRGWNGPHAEPERGAASSLISGRITCRAERPAPIMSQSGARRAFQQCRAPQSFLAQGLENRDHV